MKRWTKKAVAFLLLLALMGSLTSCGFIIRLKGKHSSETVSSEVTNDKTYTISTVEELFGMVSFVERHMLDTEVVITLENDITVNDTADFAEWVTSEEKRDELINWMPVKYFTGTFDGKGHTISGLYCCVDGNEDQHLNASLLSSIYEGATVKNLNITDSLFYSAEERTTAILATFNSGTVQNCHTRAQVYSDGMYVSLLIGRTDDGGVIENCTSAGIGENVRSGNQTYLAGICSSLDEGSEIRNCANYAALRGEFGVHIGGIVSAASGSIVNCSNYGKIENEGNDTGGIAARLSYDENAEIKYCVNYASVICTNPNNSQAGGITARFDSGTISYCENRGTVTSAYGAGGICGVSREECVTVDCLNLGEIVGMENGDFWKDNFGGIVGTQFGGRIERCCNAGTVNSGEVAGGIVGGNTGGGATVIQCWNFGALVGGSSAGGIIGAKDIYEVTVEECYNYGTQQAEQTFDFCDTGRGVAPVNCYSMQSSGYEEPITVSRYDFETVWNQPTEDARYPTLRNMPNHPPVSALAD
ncbi:MAG: hypothetical protein E7486_01365 [Ruminococcaceae bacterium]|nr:hypothetical protein [Oscillospiraceae bacterium]